MAFPLNPTDGQQYTSSNGIIYKYISSDNRWDQIGSAASVPDATTTTIGGIQLSGDFTGTATNPELAKIRMASGSYQLANITVDEKGRIVDATNGSVGNLTTTTNVPAVDVANDVNTIRNAVGQAKTDSKSAYTSDAMHIDGFVDTSGIDLTLSSNYTLGSGVVTAKAKNVALNSYGGTSSATGTVNGSFVVSNMFDGDTSTYFQPQQYNTVVTRDLGSIVDNINKLSIYLGTLSANNETLTYSVDISNDNSTWTNIVAQKSVDTGTSTQVVTGPYSDTLSSPVSARYIRLTASLTVDWIPISEWEIFTGTNGPATVVTTFDKASTQPTYIVLDSTVSGTVTFDVSVDSGSMWQTNIQTDSLVPLTAAGTGTELTVRANLASGSSMSSLGYMWYDNTTLPTAPASTSPTASGSSSNPALGSMILNDTVNLIKTNVAAAERNNLSKYTWQNFVIDAFNDASGIDSTMSSGYSLASGSVTGIPGSFSYSKGADWNKLTMSQIQSINNLLQLSQTNDTTGTFSQGTLETTTVAQQSQVAVDSNGTAHVVIATKRYISSYWNIDYVTVDKSGTVSAPVGVTKTNTWDSVNPSIALGSDGTAYIVYQSSYSGTNDQYDIAWVMVNTSGSVGPSQWLTKNGTNDSYYPMIKVDSNNVSHVVFYSYIYNSSYYNIGYVTVAEPASFNGAISPSAITWITTYTTQHALDPHLDLDSSNTAYIVYRTIYNSAYNLAYVTVDASGTVSPLKWVTTGTASSNAISIAVDSSGTSHIVFQSLIYNATYYNIGYVTIDSSGTVSVINWITQSTSANSQYPTIAVDSTGTAHIVFESFIYNASYGNIGYVTVDNTGSTSSISWITTNTATSQNSPYVAVGDQELYVSWTNGSSSLMYAAKEATSYVASGSAVGTIDAGNTVSWSEFKLTDTVPTGTSVGLTYQVSDDNSTWSTAASGTPNTPLTGVTGRYLKFELDLSTTSSTTTPEVSSLEIDYTGNGAVVTTLDKASVQPTQIVLDATTSGSVTYDLSLDNGTTWVTNITPDTFVDLTTASGSDIRVRMNLANGAAVKGLGYAWFTNNVPLAQQTSVDPGTSSVIAQSITQSQFTELAGQQVMNQLQTMQATGMASYGTEYGFVDDYRDTSGISYDLSTEYVFNTGSVGAASGTVVPLNMATVSGSGGTNGTPSDAFTSTAYSDEVNGSSEWVAVSTVFPVTFNGVSFAQQMVNNEDAYMDVYVTTLSNSNWVLVSGSVPIPYTNTSVQNYSMPVTNDVTAIKINVSNSSQWVGIQNLSFSYIPLNTTEVYSNVDTVKSAPSGTVVNAIYDNGSNGSVDFFITRNGSNTTTSGTQWLPVTLDEYVNLSPLPTGTNVQLKYVLSGTATVNGIGYSLDYTGLVASAGAGSTLSSAIAQRLTDTEINLMKTNFKLSTQLNASKYNLYNMIIDDYNDTTGISPSGSSGYTWDSSTKSISISEGVNLVPAMTSNTAPSGTASASTIENTSYDAWKAFDGTVSGGTYDTWLASTNTGWLQYDFGSQKTIGSYTITCANRSDGPTQAPQDWTLEGSNDGTTFTIIDTQTGITSWAVAGSQTYNLKSPANYRYYRLNITLDNGNSLTGVGNLALNSAVTEAVIVSTVDVASVAPSEVLLDADYTGNALFAISTNSGTTWNSVIPDALTPLSGTQGTEIMSRVILSGTATISSIGYAWS